MGVAFVHFENPGDAETAVTSVTGNEDIVLVCEKSKNLCRSLNGWDNHFLLPRATSTNRRNRGPTFSHRRHFPASSHSQNRPNSQSSRPRLQMQRIHHPTVESSYHNTNHSQSHEQTFHNYNESSMMVPITMTNMNTMMFHASQNHHSMVQIPMMMMMMMMMMMPLSAYHSSFTPSMPSIAYHPTPHMDMQGASQGSYFYTHGEHYYSSNGNNHGMQPVNMSIQPSTMYYPSQMSMAAPVYQIIYQPCVNHGIATQQHEFPIIQGDQDVVAELMGCA